MVTKLASGIKEGNNRYYNFLVSVLSMKMLFIQVRVTLRGIMTSPQSDTW